MNDHFVLQPTPAALPALRDALLEALAAAVPYAAVHEVGSTTLPDVPGKGDLDVLVRAPAYRFEDARAALSRFATDVGSAFQMVDDLLDVEGAEDEVGKRTAKDADAGKVNFVTILGAEGAQARVRLLAAQAKGHLGIFGPRAKVLCDAVEFVLDRRY